MIIGQEVEEHKYGIWLPLDEFWIHDLFYIELVVSSIYDSIGEDVEDEPQ